MQPTELLPVLIGWNAQQRLEYNFARAMQMCAEKLKELNKISQMSKTHVNSQKCEAQIARVSNFILSARTQPAFSYVNCKMQTQLKQICELAKGMS